MSAIAEKIARGLRRQARRRRRDAPARGPHLRVRASEAPGKIIAALKPELVVQPWTEDPDLAPDAHGARRRRRRGAAARRSSRGSADMQAVAAAVARRDAAARGVAVGAQDRPRAARVPGRDQPRERGRREEPDDDGQAGTGLRAASAPSCRSRTLLPGVSVEVLGPPTLEQSADDREAASDGPGRVLAPRRARRGAPSAARWRADAALPGRRASPDASRRRRAG